MILNLGSYDIIAVILVICGTVAHTLTGITFFMYTKSLQGADGSQPLINGNNSTMV